MEKSKESDFKIKSNQVKILDIQISTLNNDQIKERVCKFLRGKKQQQVVTTNPEFLLAAITDDEFWYILDRASLSVPDGIGLKFAAWLQGKNIKRLAGADLTKDILACAQAYELNVAILNYSQSLSKNQTIKQVIKAKYPKLNILIQTVERDKYEYDLTELKKFKPTAVLCTLGAPYQDKLIFRLMPQLPSVRLGMGVGGSFDFLTGQLKRAPKLMQVLGLEWLWRLILEPRLRIKRIFNAVIVFAWTAFKTTYINQYFYRKNVVGFLFNDQDEVLLLNSNKINVDYWKLPQGGVNSGENNVQAIIREMTEETGNHNFKILAEYKNIHKYNWPKNYAIMGHRGQKQTLFILKYLGQKNDIKLSLEHKGYKWVKIKDLLKEADPIVKTTYKLFLSKYHKTRGNKLK